MAGAVLGRIHWESCDESEKGRWLERLFVRSSIRDFRIRRRQRKREIQTDGISTLSDRRWRFGDRRVASAVLWTSRKCA